jgi:hypothetical protein
MRARGDRLGAGGEARTATDESARSALGASVWRVSVSLSRLRDGLYSAYRRGRECEDRDVRYFCWRIG